MSPHILTIIMMMIINSVVFLSERGNCLIQVNNTFPVSELSSTLKSFSFAYKGGEARRRKEKNVLGVKIRSLPPTHHHLTFRLAQSALCFPRLLPSQLASPPAVLDRIVQSQVFTSVFCYHTKHRTELNHVTSILLNILPD